MTGTMLRQDADASILSALKAAQPNAAVQRALSRYCFGGRVVLVAAGKAAWQMAKAAHEALSAQIDADMIVTKYDHAMGPIAIFSCTEAGHPVPDDNSFAGTQAAIAIGGSLKPEDRKGR